MKKKKVNVTARIDKPLGRFSTIEEAVIRMKKYQARKGKGTVIITKEE